ncbi:M15 family metallopeptidase [Limnoraphis robusta]|uniref:D-alanyl-D-alanine dipeptidase n=1 Tax=Limnoraphis robusta CCNP1315 TaxID=3110306 RepID=A0ABU5U867_9CYAN|nr:M15 family metallopeptidase [Limnoraphis robusta]MEA5523047.1 M15 family metallopeptidase [Limnoraphis robusta CCNP1315]MEA5548724.1 M15 family metallopeptidase [Limnoraphis robusta CCNP1324]
MIKPYQKVPVQDCGEPLLPIPLEQFAVESPHPYEKLGAPYHLSGVDSPYYLRQEVLERLITAQTQLQSDYPGWKILIFDAYRPLEVQQFMVDYTFAEIIKARELKPDLISAEERKAILEEVYQFWAVPSLDPATPPPHSTGAAIDITLVNNTGKIVDMGSPIDEISPRSYPNHFAESSHLVEQKYHQNRQILAAVMISAGFQQHPNEWWHFSYGDQMWAWLNNQQETEQKSVAKYGRYS